MVSSTRKSIRCLELSQSVGLLGTSVWAEAHYSDDLGPRYHGAECLVRV